MRGGWEKNRGEYETPRYLSYSGGVKNMNAQDKVFSFEDFITALENQKSCADLEPYGKLVEALAVELGVEYNIKG